MRWSLNSFSKFEVIAIIAGRRSGSVLFPDPNFWVGKVGAGLWGLLVIWFSIDLGVPGITGVGDLDFNGVELKAGFPWLMLPVALSALGNKFGKLTPCGLAFLVGSEGCDCMKPDCGCASGWGANLVTGALNWSEGTGALEETELATGADVGACWMMDVGAWEIALGLDNACGASCCTLPNKLVPPEFPKMFDPDPWENEKIDWGLSAAAAVCWKGLAPKDDVGAMLQWNKFFGKWIIYCFERKKEKRKQKSS